VADGSDPKAAVGGPVPPHELHAVGAPARRALAGAGFTTWDAVAAASDADLLALHGVGGRALTILREGPAQH
jgi:hypothetical protein